MAKTGTPEWPGSRAEITVRDRATRVPRRWFPKDAPVGGRGRCNLFWYLQIGEGQ